MLSGENPFEKKIAKNTKTLRPLRLCGRFKKTQFMPSLSITKIGEIKEMIVRAKVSEGKAIQKLINHYASAGLLIPLSLQEIYERIREFFVYKIEDKIIGVVSVHIVWEDLAELRSLAIYPEYQRQGSGSALVNQALVEARELEIRKVFVLTYQREFFQKMGFQQVDKAELPHKVWSDCIKCVKFPDCNEIAMVLKL